MTARVPKPQGHDTQEEQEVEMESSRESYERQTIASPFDLIVTVHLEMFNVPSQISAERSVEQRSVLIT